MRIVLIRVGGFEIVPVLETSLIMWFNCIFGEGVVHQLLSPEVVGYVVKTALSIAHIRDNWFYYIYNW